MMHRVAAAVLMLATGVVPAFAAGPITVEAPWSRATPRGATVAVGYLTIRNDGDLADRLVSASVDIAGRAAPHSMVMEGGVMKMRPLPDGVPVPAHGRVVLSPAGDHLMFEDLKRPLKVGDSFAGTLVFARAGAVAVAFTVEPIGAKAPSGAAGSGPPSMKGMKM